MSEIVYSYEISAGEQAALDRFEEVLKNCIDRNYIKDFSNNNFPDDEARGLIDYWIKPLVGKELVPFCVSDFRHDRQRDLIAINPGMPIVSVINPETGEFRDDEWMENLIRGRIGWYIRNRMTVDKLIELKQERISEIRSELR